MARSGSVAPDTDGATYTGFNGVSFNDSGHVAFTAHLTGAGVTGSNDWGIWSDRSGTLSLIVREGDTAPFFGPGVLFDAQSPPRINRNDQIVFTALLAGAVTADNDTGIWFYGSNSLALIAREGDAAPGTGVEFGSIIDTTFAVNGNGQAAFLGTLTGTGVVADVNDRGLWAQDSGGVLRLVARLGDLFDVDDTAGTDLRQISAVDFFGGSGGEDGIGSGFNDAGQLAFWLGFDDGSEGVFVANLGALPCGSADLDGDGDVDLNDYVIFQQQFTGPQ